MNYVYIKSLANIFQYVNQYVKYVNQYVNSNLRIFQIAKNESL